MADALKGASNCDDLGFLDGHLFMGCENKTLNTGGSGDSTLVGYTPAGTVLHTRSIKHEINGRAGDPLTHKVIVSLDENKNPHTATVTPLAPAGRQVTYYNYSPNPDAAATPTALRTGGGINHVSVDATGHVLVTASNAQRTTGTAVFKVTPTPPKQPKRHRYSLAHRRLPRQRSRRKPTTKPGPSGSSCAAGLDRPRSRRHALAVVVDVSISDRVP